MQSRSGGNTDVFVYEQPCTIRLFIIVGMLMHNYLLLCFVLLTFLCLFLLSGEYGSSNFMIFFFFTCLLVFMCIFACISGFHYLLMRGVDVLFCNF